MELHNIDVYVPLGLEERKQQQKVSGDFSAEQFNQQVTITPISEEQFNQQVLRAGQSPTSQGKRLAIIGEAGAGKTTRLQMIAHFILNENLGLPIWVPLRRLTSVFGLADFLENWLQNATGQKNLWSDFQAQFQAGKVWLLLDGLDEMTDRSTLDHGDLLQGWWSEARFIVSCRVNVWDNDRGAFNHFDAYRNLHFQLDELQCFITKFFHKVEKLEVGEELWSRLQEENHERLRDLVSNPLRLFLLCWAWYQGERNLPETQASLYEQLVNHFVEPLYRWKSSIFTISPEQRQQLQVKLSELALMAINGRDQAGQVIPRFWFTETLLKQVFGTIDDPICKLAIQVGLINQLGQTAETPIEKAYAFYHVTFQEYFAALGVVHWDYFLPRSHINFPVKDGQYRIFASEWEQVILLWLGRGDIRDEVKEEFIRKLVNFDDGCGEWNFDKIDKGFYEYKAYFLAGLGINKFQTHFLADQIIKQIVERAFCFFNEKENESNFFIVSKAYRNILPSSRTKVVNNLIHLLKPIDNTHIYINYDLTTIHQNTLIIQLISILENTNNYNIHNYVGDSLSEIAIGNNFAINRLICFLQKTDNLSLLWTITNTLGKIAIGNELAIQTLVSVLKSTHNNRSWVAISLAKIDAPNEFLITELINILETDNYNIYWSVAVSLVKIDPTNEFISGKLIRILQTTDDYIIVSDIVNILGKLAVENDFFINKLIDILQNTNNYSIFFAVGNILSKLAVGNDFVINKLIDILQNTDDYSISSEVGNILSKLAVGNDFVINKLIDILQNSDDYNIFQSITKVLGEIALGNNLAIQTLVSILKSTDSDNRSYIAGILCKIDPKNELAIRELIYILEITDNDFHRIWVAGILCKTHLGNELAIHELLRILQTTDDYYIRKFVTSTLKEIVVGNDLAICELIRILENTDKDYIHWNVVVILSQQHLRSEFIISELIRILETTDNDSISYYTSYCISYLTEVIIITNEDKKIVIHPFRKYLNSVTYKNNSSLFKKSYETLWNIAQNLTYPEFYQAWHKNPLPVNLAQLPQLLQEQIANHNLTETYQIYLIDGSKFIDQDNPSLDIYEQLLDQQCQPRPNGEPENLSQLKSYWGQIRRNSDKKTILIFYENSTPSTPQGFSPKFINTLSRFEGAIALIDDNIQSDNIKTFTSQDPNLLQNIIDWIKTIS